MPIKIKKLCGLLIILFILPLSGCFDYDVVLDLKEDGSGNLAVELKVPSRWGGKKRLQKVKTILLPPPHRESEEKHGRFVFREISDFRFLDEIAAYRVHVKIDTADKGIIAITDYTHRMTVTLKPVEGDFPDRLKMPGQELETRKVEKPKEMNPAEARAQRLMARTLKGHFITMHLKLPGSVKEARPLVIGSKMVKPKLEGNESEVIWWVPLSDLAEEKVRHNLVFSVDFNADLEFRAERHAHTASRHPTKKDELLAERLAAEQAAEQAKEDGATNAQ